MSSQSQATIFTAWANAIKIVDEIRRAAARTTNQYPTVNATNIATLLNTLQTSYAGDFLDDEEDAIEAVRGSIASTLSPATVAAIHRPWLRQYLKDVVGRTDLTNDLEMWQEMYRHMQANNVFVQSRKMTYGTPSLSAASVGNGQIVRLTRDRYNFPIESGYVESKRARCIFDAQSGTGIGQEVWELKGQASARDEIERSGSGLLGTLIGQTIDDSVLNNAGFRSFGGTAGSDAPTSLTNWTSNLTFNSTNFGIDQTNYFRKAPSDGTAGSLVMKATGRITQLLSAARNTGLNVDSPYLMAVAWNRAVNSATGTLTFGMGTKYTAVTLAAQTGWNVTLVPSATGQGNWFKNFNEAALDFWIDWTQTGGTGVLIGEVLMLPGTYFDGCFYWAIPNSTAAYVAHRILDEFTWPDTVASASAQIQNWIHRAYPGIYLPSSDGSSITFSAA